MCRPLVGTPYDSYDHRTQPDPHNSKSCALCDGTEAAAEEPTLRSNRKSWMESKQFTRRVLFFLFHVLEANAKKSDRLAPERLIPFLETGISSLINRDELLLADELASGTVQTSMPFGAIASEF